MKNESDKIILDEYLVSRPALKNWDISELRKFTKAIVSKCSDLAQGDRGCGEYKQARNAARTDILDHFGIKDE
jgi:hypothetical protein